jgi:glutamate-1-semialdehyde aminotransferase/predicted aldo/keto reductase-like oxidoreductase
MMNYRRLGRTNLQVSVVAFGTCQFRLLPERQALATLQRGFELGVNLVHTAPDYEGADDLVIRAVRESGRDVMVCSQGYGALSHFEYLFESTCAQLGKKRLELFGIACVDDRETLGENVWGAGGMVEFLRRKKDQGRLGGTFCTTHGTPEYIRKLIESGAFDAIMMAYNPLGFHLLSWGSPERRPPEDLARNKDELFPLARQHDVGLMIMKPLAGGLLCRGKAFPPRADLSGTVPAKARDVLRQILANPEVSCVVPGTCSVAEAEENALAGHGTLTPHSARRSALHTTIEALKKTVCSRCGACDTQCSKHLSLSWIFRAAYINTYPSETFETLPRLEYSVLHPAGQAACATCENVTCACPAGVDIPGQLTRIHGTMMALRDQELIPPPPGTAAPTTCGALRARAVIKDIPATAIAGEPVVCRLTVENAGQHCWFPVAGPEQVEAHLRVTLGADRALDIPLRAPVPPGERGHFAFELPSPQRPGSHRLRFLLQSRQTQQKNADEVLLLERDLVTELAPTSTVASRPVYGARYVHHNFPESLPAGSIWVVWLCLENTGTRVWRRQPPDGHRTDLAVYLAGELYNSVPMPRDEVKPGEQVYVQFNLRTPAVPGCVQVKLDLVEQGITLFEHQKVAPLVLDIHLTPPDSTATARAIAVAERANPWFWQPAQGLHKSPDGRTYPLLARKAVGCTITDLEGREFLDYIMGWGCTLLGYAHPAIQKAIAEVLDTCAVIPVPHQLEMDVTEALCAEIPCAEMVLFGKNGSDVCTAAARLARVTTGKNTILFCGYHGWQDWWIEQLGFAATGIPDRPKPLIHRFAFNKLDDFRRLLKQHQGDLAAVMLEPAAPAEGIQGPVEDADRTFLREVAALTRQHGALLIFDEIITGFRYPGGSVQKATGVVPDLACFGKALAAGMPLSALVGRRDLFERGMARIQYGPTFKGEVYSLAAARAALQVYCDQDVAGHVWRYGTQLRDGINDLCQEHGVPGALIGPPFRLVMAFREPEPERNMLLRTLLQQELMKAGLLTYKGYMLPGLAHDSGVLDRTLVIFDQALALLARVRGEDSFARHLEILPIN